MAHNSAQLMLKCEPDGKGCCVFTGYKNKKGYGQIRFRGVRMWAHRAFYIAFKGAIPKGKEIDHLCKNTSCVLPSHLEAVTHQENQRRGNSWVGKNARKTECPKGHPYSKENTYINPHGARVCRTCAKARNAAYLASMVVRRLKLCP